MSNNEINVLDKNFCFSKVLKGINVSLKFKEYSEEKSLFLLNKYKIKNRERAQLLQRKYNHDEILYNLKKAYDENEILIKMKMGFKNNELNKSKEKLPILLNKSKKENEQNNPEKKGSNNPLLEDNKEPPVEFENVWKIDYLKRLQEKKNMTVEINDDTENKIDIFDKRYKTIKQKNFFTLHKIKVLERIKGNHSKVQNKLKNYKTLMDKYSEKKEYTPKYNILEKHTPEIKLDSKSKRIFPFQFIKMNNYSDGKKILKKKLSKSNSNQNASKTNYSINPCSLFNKYKKYNSIQNDSIYSRISKSTIVNNKTNTSLSQGYKTKINFSLLHDGNFLYKM